MATTAAVEPHEVAMANDASTSTKPGNRDAPIRGRTPEACSVVGNNRGGRVPRHHARTAPWSAARPPDHRRPPLNAQRSTRRPIC
jgi:hypothetical protein